MVRWLFPLTGLFAVALAAVLVIAPASYLDLYLLRQDPDRVFAAQRLSPAIAGLGLMLILMRDLPPGPLLSRIAGVGALVWAGGAATGLYHFATGVAGASILVAAALEVLLAVLFALAALQSRF